mgnify:CR=1 FL=1
MRAIWSLMLCVLMLTAVGCGDKKTGGDTTNATDNTGLVEKMNGKAHDAAREWINWGLRRVGDLSSTASVAAAKNLQIAANKGVMWLEKESSIKTVEKVNSYLCDTILSSLNPAVGAGIDMAARILDSTLGIDANKTLTEAELKLVASFVRGISDGCTDYLAGKLASPPQLISKPSDYKPRYWMVCAPKKT